MTKWLAIPVAAALGAVAYLALAQAGPVRIPFEDEARVAEGEALYAEHCAACHGTDLEGQPDWQTRNADGRLPAPPHDETGHTWHHQDALLFRITKEGTADVVGGGYESDMMGFGEVLSDAEILSVLAYIKSTWSARVQETHERLNGRGG